MTIPPALPPLIAHLPPMFFRKLPSIAIPWVVAGLQLTLSANEPVQFNRDIRPILNDNCFYCHGFDEANRKADLRLDTFEAATEYAIVPGKPEVSELLLRMLSDDPGEVMPPPETEKALSESQIELIRRWIAQGADFEEHWSWKPLQRPDVPETVSDPIDWFLAEGWNESRVSPVQPAAPRELLRRLSFDLRGLPPTPEEVARFESDPSGAALMTQRDEWMQQLAYAEHQAVSWLDLVRWADTSGFVSDEPIASGAYRAWVIRSISQNMPFDEFSKWQLAGDLLNDPSDEQLIASGYNRIVNTNCEAGAIEVEQLYQLKGEHVRALGAVWLGLTTGCAECHDHKFDPISAKDYYSLAAFYDDLIEAGVYTPGDRREPLHYVFDDAPKSHEDGELAEQIRELQNKLTQVPPVVAADWEHDIRASLNDKATRQDYAWIPSELPAMRILEGDFEAIERAGKPARESVAASGELSRHCVAELMTGFFDANHQKSDAEKDAWFVDVWIDENARPEMLGFQVLHGDYGRLGWETANYETYVWGDDTSGTLANEQSWSSPKRVKRMGDLPSQSGWVRLRVPFSNQVPAEPGKSFKAVGMGWMHTGGRVAWGDSGLEIRTDKATALTLGESGIRHWWQRPYNRHFFEKRMELVAETLRKPVDERDELQQELAAAAFHHHSQPEQLRQLKALESERHTRRSRWAVPVLVSRQSESWKTTRVLHRGDYQDESGEIALPAFPEFLTKDTGNPQHRLTRLDLAEWLFDEGSPLVARVFVNRLWHQFYGRGLSESLEDSGTQGGWPSHLRLLDYLACEFRDSGWDRDHLVRLMTSADAYRLSSIASESLWQSDPTNRFHARQSRHRLPAEAIRDTALTAAGLLDENHRIPIDSFFPYQPDAYWSRSDKVMYGSRHMPWRTSGESTQYQRTLYTFWKRQNIHPMMMALDAPTRQECTAQRNISNTPGQALALLNDPIFVESARVFATRVLEPTGIDDVNRIDAAFALALQRNATTQELDVMLELLGSQREHFRDNPELADQLVSIGQSPLPHDAEPEEVAAWTILTRSLLNLHEFLSRP